MRHAYITGFLLLSLWMRAEAQSTLEADTTPTVAQREKKEHKERSRWWMRKPLPDPNIAFFYSAIFPGLGQIYNHKYWKAPIVWGGIAGGAYLISIQQDRYFFFKKDLYGLLRDKGQATPSTNYQTASGLTESQLRSQIDAAQRNRDLFTAITILWYMLQAVEAHVDAHLSFFKKNPTLKVSLEPVSDPRGLFGQGYAGLGVTVKF